MRRAEKVPALAVLDASVAVRWVVPEVGSDEAAELLLRPIAWIAPRLMLTEAASALRRKVAAGELTTAISSQALDTLVQAIADGILRLVDDEAFVSSALMLAITHDHRMPDCLYLALAERHGAAIATAERRLAGLARQRGVTALTVPSA